MYYTLLTTNGKIFKLIQFNLIKYFECPGFLIINYVCFHLEFNMEGIISLSSYSVTSTEDAILAYILPSGKSENTNKEYFQRNMCKSVQIVLPFISCFTVIYAWCSVIWNTVELKFIFYNHHRRTSIKYSASVISAFPVSLHFPVEYSVLLPS